MRRGMHRMWSGVIAVACALAGMVGVADVAAAAVPCAPSGLVPAALVSCRGWITYSPPAPFNPSTSTFPSEAQIQSSLQLLFNEGWRGLVTYDMSGTLREVPRIAKEVGFTKVIAGIFWFDDIQLNAERPAVIEEKDYFDGLVVGNEGLLNGRYTRVRLETELENFRTATGRPVTTSETADQYLADTSLFTLGDWVFPNMHPWWAGQRTPETGAKWAMDKFRALEMAAGGRPLVIKESWWPTGGTEPAAANAANQSDYFSRLSRTPVRFIWGEAFDQSWKTGEPGGVGPTWGFHTSAGVAKQVIADLVNTYTVPYPPVSVMAGLTWYSNGGFNLSGPRGSLLTLYATQARFSTYVKLVSGLSGVSDPPCRFDPQPINPNVRLSSVKGFVGNTSGVIDRPAGTWDICFYESAPGVVGRSVTVLARFTVTG